MIRNHNEFFRTLFNINRYALSVRQTSSSKINIEKLEQESALIDVIDDDALRKEEYIERKRNKSRLKVADRNFLLEENPYPEANFWHHGTLKYMRRLYGRYGAASGVNPAICWPVKKELQESLEYEKIKYPFTIPDMIKEAKEKKDEKEEMIRVRQEGIVKKMQKLEEWKQDLHNRIAKKQGEALAAKERKERLIEEVRRHFGFTVDPKDDRFKEMLEKKEKEQKKAMKEARRKVQEQKMVDKLTNKTDEKTLEKKVDAAEEKDK